MAFSGTDIKWRFSVPAGAAAGNVVVQTTPAASLGGYMAANQIPGSTLHGLFPRVSGADNEAGLVQYRCVFVYNTNASSPALAVKAWVASDPTGGADVAIGLDPTGLVDGSSAIQQAVISSSETAAPGGVAFSSPGSYAAGLAIGTLPALGCIAIWVRRTASGGSAANPETVSISVGGDDGA